ncbi:MAG: archease [Candidatus Acidiferrales bacterium]
MSDRIDHANPKFEILEHPADIGFVAYGVVREELFQNAGLALISIAGDVGVVRESERREMELTGESDEELLYAWLSEIVAVMDAERLALARVEVESLDTKLGEGRLRGAVYGERYDRARHAAGVAIKAVTYHQFAIERAEVRYDGSGGARTEMGWRARVYLDL